MELNFITVATIITFVVVAGTIFVSTINRERRIFRIGFIVPFLAFCIPITWLLMNGYILPPSFYGNTSLNETHNTPIVSSPILVPEAVAQAQITTQDVWNDRLRYYYDNTTNKVKK